MEKIMIFGFATILGLYTVSGPKPWVATNPGQERISPGIEKPWVITNIQPAVVVTPGIQKPTVTPNGHLLPR